MAASFIARARCAAFASSIALACFAFASSVAQPQAGHQPVCPAFDITHSSAYDARQQRIVWDYRTDYPTALAPSVRPWRATKGFDHKEWRDYLKAALDIVEQSGVIVENKRLIVPATAPWWIAPWMDYGPNGRERIVGLTQERGPDPKDLSPRSPGNEEVWAIGFYNSAGAFGLGQVFASPCDPMRPKAGWTFPEGTMSFKFLFTTASPADVDYLFGAPEVIANTDGGVKPVRLLQVDIGIRDQDSPTGWVFGTYVWKGPPRGDGLYDNLVPVGVIWGNDDGKIADPRALRAQIAQTRLNEDLKDVVWGWPQRPWPGFQGRLNGPADNLRSSCTSCHGFAQWPRSSDFSIVPRAQWSDLDKPAVRQQLVENYMLTRPGGQLMHANEAGPPLGATPLDYSLQIEAGFSRMCDACRDGRMTGATPAVCAVSGLRRPITTPSCPAPKSIAATMSRIFRARQPPPRQ